MIVTTPPEQNHDHAFIKKKTTAMRVIPHLGVPGIITRTMPIPGIPGVFEKRSCVKRGRAIAAAMWQASVGGLVRDGVSYSHSHVAYQAGRLYDKARGQVRTRVPVP